MTTRIDNSTKETRASNKLKRIFKNDNKKNLLSIESNYVNLGVYSMTENDYLCAY